MKINRLVTTRRIIKTPANYQLTSIPGYDGNPLIEALPPIMDTEQAIKSLAKRPRYFDKELRNLPAHKRYHLIQSFSKFFTPMDVHLDLERRFACAFRIGYMERNPLEIGYWNKVSNAIDSLKAPFVYVDSEWDNYESTAAYGFNIIGISGIGKSQTISLILRNYPQVIFHNAYKSNLLTETQLVWLKLDCPFDGSIRGLCINFFQHVDTILGNNYSERYIKNDRITADMMLPDIASVAMNHHLGILVIDEIQRISLSKSGGEQNMLNFFVQLVNTIGIPVCLIGTYKALDSLSKYLSQLRRGTGQGDLLWDRMQPNEEWDYFAKNMGNTLLHVIHPQQRN